MSDAPNAKQFLARLDALRSDEELAKIQRYFKTGEGQYGAGDVFVGVRMGQVFDLAKTFIDMPLGEIEALLCSEVHEARAGAVSIMAKQAGRKATTADQRRALFDLYVRRHDRINNWDLVDLGAKFVVGAYLADKPRDLLYRLARSGDLWEKRTAIIATLHFVSRGDLDDTFALAQILVGDDHDLTHKAVGGLLREAGKKDRGRLTAFLERHAATMPRTMLRYAIEHFTPDERARFMRPMSERGG